MKLRPFQFTLKRLLFAMLLFGVAFVLLSHMRPPILIPEDNEDPGNSVSQFMLLLLGGTGVFGAGIGALFNRPITGALALPAILVVGVITSLFLLSLMTW